MPERCEILVWCYVATEYSKGHKFSNFTFTNSKITKRSQYQDVHLSNFELIWKSYGKRLIAQVVVDNTVMCCIVINMAQFGQVALLPQEMKGENRVSCYFERDDGYILAIVHRTANFISIEIADQFTQPDSSGYDPFFDRPRWLASLSNSCAQFTNKPICEALLDQRYFNGVGNWMRSEILHLSGILPFDSLATIVQSEQQLTKLTNAMDQILVRTLQLMDTEFDINDIMQKQSFDSSLLVYGRGQRIVYNKIGNKQKSKALWIALDMKYLGALASKYNITATRRSSIKVGPWEGWDSTVASSYGPIKFGGPFWHLSHHVQEAFAPRKTAGRPRVIRTGKRGRPKRDTLPPKTEQHEQTTAMPKERGTQGGRLIHLTSRIYTVLIWLLSRALPSPTQLDFVASESEKEEAQRHASKFVVIGVGDEEWPKGRRLQYQATGQLYVPDECKRLVLEHNHPRDALLGPGTHPGRTRMHKRIKQTYYNITQSDISAHIADCQWCNRNNANRNQVDDVVPILSSQVNERWVIDTTYMLELGETNDGYKYIATGMDHFSKFPFAIPLKGRSARDWAQALAKLCYQYDAPDVLHADNGGEFRNQVMKELEQLLQVQIIHGNPYSPNEQGLVERWNQTLKIELTKLMEQSNTTNWVQFLPQVCASYAMTPHTVTRVTPFELFFGRKPRRIVALDSATVSADIEHYTEEQYQTAILKTAEKMEQVRQVVEDRIVKNGETMKKQKAKKTIKSFKVGARVLVHFSMLPPAVLAEAYNPNIAEQVQKYHDKRKQGKKVDFTKIKLAVGQAVYAIGGFVHKVTKSHCYKVTLDSGEKLGPSIRSTKLKRVTFIGPLPNIKEKSTSTTELNTTDTVPPLVSTVSSESESDSVSDVSMSTDSDESCNNPELGSQSDIESTPNPVENSETITPLTLYSTRRNSNLSFDSSRSLSAHFKQIKSSASRQVITHSNL